MESLATSELLSDRHSVNRTLVSWSILLFCSEKLLIYDARFLVAGRAAPFIGLARP